MRVDTTCCLRPSRYGERIAAFHDLCPNERVSNASPGTSCFVQAKDQDMRDFRDSKAMGTPYVRPSPRKGTRSRTAKASN
jgi:hypothetical protein